MSQTSGGPSPSDDDLAEREFDKLARLELASLEDALADVDPDDVEVTSSDGILRLAARDGTKIVINAHRAARQIWMAAVSTAWHFDRQPDGTWLAARTGESFRVVLAALLARHGNVVVTLV